MEHTATIAEVRDAVARARASGRTIGLVPTMGALHEGHLSLVRLAADRADAVLVSVFVNPTQFDRDDDLAAYPRDLEGDLAALSALGAATPAMVFVPDTAEIYPREQLATVRVARLSEPLEGASRPGHFEGVATVVTKLLNIVAPDLAVFGRKDLQQLQVIRRLVADLDLPVEVLAGPTVREHDGLALSSRNRRLSPREREAALSLSRGLRAAVELARAERATGAGVVAAALEEAAAARLRDAAEVRVDYVAAVDPDTFAPPEPVRADGVGGGAVAVAIAAHVGPVRLIDNVELGDLDDEDTLLAAVR